MLYWAVTSLSTVGFGDYVPRSDLERAVGAFMLLCGVAVFSYIMGNFISILDSYMTYNKDLEEGSLLSRFFGTLLEFNNKEPINQAMKTKIEAFFDYRWKNDKNAAFEQQQDLDFYDQMPLTVKVILMRDFMHKDFLLKFKKQFVFPNLDILRKHAYYGWDDEPYVMYMFDVLKYLEPIMEPAGSVIQEQNEEVNEVTFFDFGQYLVGFEINKI